MALYTAIEAAGGAVLATSESDGRGHTNVLGGDENLRAIGARAGASNLPGRSGWRAALLHAFDDRSADAFRRRRRAPKPACAAVGVCCRRSYIDFRGPAGTVPAVSLSALLRGDVDARVLRGRTVVVGATAPTVHDQHATAAGDALMAGPEVQANAIWTLLHGMPLRDAPDWMSLLAIGVMSLLVPLLALCLRPLLAAVLAPALAFAFLALSQVAFEAGMILPVVAPLLGLTVATVATVAASHILESLARQRIAHRNDILQREVRDAELEIIQRLGQAVESRDEETGEHIDRIGDLAHRLGLAAGLSADEAERLRRASAMHDVGKIAIPDSILHKPGRLDPQERAIMETHTTIGAQLLSGSRSPLVQMAEVIARTHHERWDGTGYPAGLAGEAIPLVGRITALCDVYDALTSKRAYKPAWTIQDALDEIERESGRHFDPELTAHFLALNATTNAVSPSHPVPVLSATNAATIIPRHSPHSPPAECGERMRSSA